LLGGISGWYGGWIDTAIQRVIEFLRSIPTIPLWMGMAAAVPTEWPPLWVYFMITLIVSLLAWTSLAREVRGKFMALRNEDFVVAARLDGMSDLGIIFRHLVPSFLSHIIATLTLAIPVMILAETSLSFLGIGLQPPIVSWGVLLQEAQNLRAVSSAPWLLFVPGTAVVLAILCLNFLGDGIRDAADPYGR
jgi:peptide/nickel transport system permease protein